ncbi:MAG: hypothetical protein ACODAE_08710 [Gemmatimonadota bacterium]
MLSGIRRVVTFGRMAAVVVLAASCTDQDAGSPIAPEDAAVGVLDPTNGDGTVGYYAVVEEYYHRGDLTIELRDYRAVDPLR